MSDTKKNLISIGQLDSTGYATGYGKGSWKIVNGAMVVAHGTKSGTLYTTARYMNMVAIAESSSNPSLWHNILGHLSVKGMKMILGHLSVEGMKMILGHLSVEGMKMMVAEGVLEGL